MNPLNPQPKNSGFQLQQFAIAKRTKKLPSFDLGWEKYILSSRQKYIDFRASNQYDPTPSKCRAMSTRSYLFQQGIEPETMAFRPQLSLRSIEKL